MSKKKRKDPLQRLKQAAYYKVFGDPEQENYTFDELLNVAKSYLCNVTNRLLADPIWDNYSNEELLVEYYAQLFMRDQGFRQAFETNSEVGKSEYDDFLQFADRKIEEAEQERQQLLDGLEEKISFKPNDVLGGE